MKSATFIKNDNGKPRIELVPSAAIVGMARGFTLGATKYEVDNWKLCQDWGRIYGAAQRHLLAYISGQLIDADSGERNLDLALCNLAMLAWKEEQEQLRSSAPMHVWLWNLHNLFSLIALLETTRGK
jgi:hypothetical protein